MTNLNQLSFVIQVDILQFLCKFYGNSMTKLASYGLTDTGISLYSPVQLSNEAMCKE